MLAAQPPTRLLIANPQCYSQLVGVVFECLLAYLLNIITVNYLRRELFHEVYAKPNVVFNFLYDMGFNTYWLDKWHNAVDFYIAYQNCDVYKFIMAPDRHKGTPGRVLDKHMQLLTNEARVSHIEDWYKKFCEQNPRHIQVCMVSLSEKPLYATPHTISATFEDQLRLLTDKLSIESDSNFFTVYNEMNHRQMAATEKKHDAAKVGILTKQQNELDRKQ